MPQVAVRVNGREYDLTCGEGEEVHLRELAQYVDEKINAIRGGGVNLSDAQLLLMAAIVIADELSDATQPAGKAGKAAQSGSGTMADLLNAGALRLEQIAARIDAI